MASMEAGAEVVAEEDSPSAKYVKPVRLSLHLIVKRHLPLEATGWSHDEIISELNKIRRVRLDRENIGDIDSLELFSAEVTHLYLQSNRINCIQNLECLPNLQVLVLSNNQIKKIEGICHLQKLLFLELAENCIETVSTDELPQSIIILNLTGNSCVENSCHRLNLIKALPKLKQLDGVEISASEKIQAGIELSDDDDGKEDDDEEEKEKDEFGLAAANERMIPPDGLQGKAYKQLPKIQTSIQDVVTEMLVRSQKRLEDSVSEYKRHVQEMTNIRIKAKIRPEPRLSKPL